MAYQVFTVVNLYSVLRYTSGSKSGEHLLGYEAWQTVANPLIRFPHRFWPVFEKLFLERLLGAEGFSLQGYLAYFFLEVAVLDFTLGAVAWFLVLSSACGILAKGKNGPLAGVRT